MHDLILLHGALGSAEQFLPLRELLSNDFQTYTFNFSGHGGRDLSSGFSIDFFAGELSDFIVAHRLHQADIFGYSMGGYVALKTAMNHPDSIGKIMTLGTKFDWGHEALMKEVRMLQPDIVEVKVPAFASALRSRHFPQDWKLLMKRTADMMMALSESQSLGEEDLRQLPHQVLITVGDEDTLVTIEESKIAAHQMPNASFKIIPGFKHPVEAVDLKVLSQEIRSFFSHDHSSAKIPT